MVCLSESAPSGACWARRMEVLKRIPRSGAKIRIRDAACGLHTARHPKGKIVEERMDCLLSGLSSRKSQAGFAVPNLKQASAAELCNSGPELPLNKTSYLSPKKKGRLEPVTPKRPATVCKLPYVEETINRNQDRRGESFRSIPGGTCAGSTEPIRGSARHQSRYGLAAGPGFCHRGTSEIRRSVQW
jgi:hypothetical protein